MYRKLPLQQQQTIGNEKELKYRNPVIFKEFGNPTSLCFHGKKLFTGCSTRVQIYAGHELFKSVSLKDLVTSVDVRQDGRLFACGDNMGVVRVYDSESRSVLRTLVGHKGAVKNVKFMHQTNRLISSSDDNTIILWDVTAETILQQYSGENGHSDYVRGLCVCAASPHLFVSGSYDHTLKLWDTNTNTCLLTLDHQHPVESLLVLKQMTILISTGGNKIKIWDLLTGKLIQVFGCHQKTVTSCSVDSKQEWLFTGSLDHQVKIISLSDYKVLKTIKYPNPVLCVMVGNNDQELAVGMTGGLLCVRNRIKEVKEKEVTKLKRGTYDYLMRGGDQAPAMVNNIK